MPRRAFLILIDQIQFFFFLKQIVDWLIHLAIYAHNFIILLSPSQEADYSYRSCQRTEAVRIVMRYVVIG